MNLVLQQKLQRQSPQYLGLSHSRGENPENDDQTQCSQIAFLNICSGGCGSCNFSHTDFTFSEAAPQTGEMEGSQGRVQSSVDWVKRPRSCGTEILSEVRAIAGGLSA